MDCFFWETTHLVPPQPWQSLLRTLRIGVSIKPLFYLCEQISSTLAKTMARAKRTKKATAELKRLEAIAAQIAGKRWWTPVHLPSALKIKGPMSENAIRAHVLPFLVAADRRVSVGGWMMPAAARATCDAAVAELNTLVGILQSELAMNKSLRHIADTSKLLPVLVWRAHRPEGARFDAWDAWAVATVDAIHAHIAKIQSRLDTLFNQ
jgi:hypothetical protein